MEEQNNIFKPASAEKFSEENSMEKNSNAALEAHPEQYLNTASSTLIILIKLLEGFAAGFSLYHVFRIVYPFITELLKGALELNDVLQLIIAEFGFVLSAEVEKMLSDTVFGGLSLSFLIGGGGLLVVIIALLLVIIEAVALLEIRIAKKGAGIVKIIHQLYMWINIGAAILVAVSLYDIVKYQKTLKNNVSSDSYDSISMFWTALIVFCVICVIALILVICYHKDIAIA
ncbi:MAG: hypothetical protein K6G27_06700, partial [Lachnospiraceae bacterium]|nr:hypothetical protein [Lachnospiraceae bacterium]